MSEIDKFFEGLKGEENEEVDIFAPEEAKPEGTAEEKPAEEAGAEEKPEKESEPRKNRRHRRLEDQLQKEREARIAAEARAEARAAVIAEASAGNIDERLTQLYGPENLEAARIHQALLNDYAAKGKEEAIKEVEERNAKVAREQAEFETLIDDELEAIEDEFDVDITSDAPAARKARREFLALVEKLSPKDERGTVTAFADFHETWELYQAKREKPAPAARAKEIAARTMEKSGTGQATPAAPSPGFRGWMRDFNING